MSVPPKPDASCLVSFGDHRRSARPTMLKCLMPERTSGQSSSKLEASAGLQAAPWTATAIRAETPTPTGERSGVHGTKTPGRAKLPLRHTCGPPVAIGGDDEPLNVHDQTMRLIMSSTMVVTGD